MYLEENIERLNKIYSKHPFHFVKENNYIKIEQEDAYYFTNNEELKLYLRDRYKTQYHWNKKLRYIGVEGIKILSIKPIKYKPTKKIDVLKKELDDYIDKIKEESLKISIRKLLDDNPYFFKCPAALSIHHTYEGGLLEHSVQTVRLAWLSLNNLDTITDISVISNDLIIAGSILHDIGKIKCYKLGDGFIQKTNTYIEQGHIISGVALVSKYIKSKHLDDIIHIITSHHYTKEWGSPKEPKSFEAWIVHTQENLSAKIGG